MRWACDDVGLTVRQCLVWVKNALVLGRQDYHWKHEPCLYGWADGAAHTWLGDRSQTTVLAFDKPARNGDHPTMKPVALFAYLIGNSCPKGGVVLDPFGGSWRSPAARPSNRPHGNRASARRRSTDGSTSRRSSCGSAKSRPTSSTAPLRPSRQRRPNRCER